MFDSDEDGVQEDENNNQPVESLALDKATYAKPEHNITQSPGSVSTYHASRNHVVTV